MKHLNISILFAISMTLSLFSSCSKSNIFLTKKDQPYLQTQDAQTVNKYTFEEYRVQAQDLLTVNLNSPDPTTNLFFNREGGGMRVNQPNQQSMYLNGYLINQNGTINLPLIGELPVVGLTLLEIEKLVEKKLKEIHPDNAFTVSAKLANFRITVLGEVMRPGMYYFYESKNTLLQAISLAGDFDEYANRKKIRIVREFTDKTETYVVDVSGADFLSSQQFILRPGDVVYVEPIRSKVFSTNTRNSSVLISAISVFLSAVTTAITLYRLSQP